MTKRVQNLLSLYMYTMLLSTWVICIVLSIGFLSSGLGHRNIGEYRAQYVSWEQKGYIQTHDTFLYLLGIVISITVPIISWQTIRRFPIISRICTHHKALILWIISLGTPLIFFASIKLFLPQILDRQRFHMSTYAAMSIFDNMPYLALITFAVGFGPYFISIIRSMWRALPYRFPETIPTYLQICFLLLIGVLIINPRYKYSFISLGEYGGEANYQFHHVISYIGPINAVLHGKTLFIDEVAQYGYGATYLPALIFRYVGLSFSGFNAYVISISCLYVLGVYIWFLRSTKKWYIAMVGTGLFVKLSFFRHIWLQEIYIYPGITPIRYGADIIALLALSLEKRNQGILRTIIISLCIAIAPFYNLEMGTPIVIAYIGMHIIDWIQTRKIVPTMRAITSVLITGAVVAIACIGGIYIHTGQMINLSHFPSYSLSFGKGYFDIPMPFIGPYLIPLSMYLLTYFVILWHIWTKSNKSLHYHSFLMIYGVLIFMYYVGFSEPNHLYTIIHPALFLMMLYLSESRLLQHILSQTTGISQNILYTYILVLCVFVLWKPGHMIDQINLLMHRRYAEDMSLFAKWKYDGTGIYLIGDDEKPFALAADAIRKYNPSEKALILSRYDTLLSVMAGKSSITRTSYLEYGFLYEKEYEETKKFIKTHAPDYVFVARHPYDLTENDAIPRIWDDIQEEYTFVADAGAVSVYKRKI